LWGGGSGHRETVGDADVTNEKSVNNSICIAVELWVYPSVNISFNFV